MSKENDVVFENAPPSEEGVPAALHSEEISDGAPATVGPVPATILFAALSPKGNVLCWFDKEWGGAKTWQYFLNAFERLVEDDARTFNRPAKFLDPKKTLGRGARVLLRPAVFQRVLRQLKQDDAVEPGLAKKHFRIKISKALRTSLKERAQRARTVAAEGEAQNG